MIIDWIQSSTINDHLLILAPLWTVWLAFVATTGLGVGSMWLANLEQPKPSKGLWQLSAVDREVQARR